MRAAIYLRISKRDGSQTVENQRQLLVDFISKQEGWKLTLEYSDEESGASGDREQFQKMMQDAEKRRFDVLVFYALDRLTREGAYKTLDYLNRLTAWGVAYRSYTEQYLDSCGVFKDAVVSILGVIAKQERLRLSERVRAGMSRAKSQGRHMGKRPVNVDLEAFRKANKTFSLEELMDTFKIKRSTVYNLRKRL